MGTCLPSVGTVTDLGYRVSVQKYTPEVDPDGVSAAELSLGVPEGSFPWP